MIIFRFKIGDAVWVRDYRHPHGVKVVEAVVLDLHEHPGRHPWYPNGEGYDLEGDLWWTCYPGCRIFATKEAAKAGRLPQNETQAEEIAHDIAARLNPQKYER